MAAERIRHAHDRGLGDRRVQQERALHLEGADAIARALDDVVGAPLEPEVPVGIPAREVAARHPRAPVQRPRPLGIVPVPERVVALRMRLHADVADHIVRHLMPLVVHDRRRAAWERPSHRAGLDLHVDRVEVADRQAELARAVVVHHRHAPLLAEEGDDLGVQRLAAAARGAHAHRIASHRLGAERHEAAQQGRRRGEVRHAGVMEAHERALGRGRRLLKGHGHAHGEREHVAHQPVAPAGVPGGPEDVVGPQIDAVAHARVDGEQEVGGDLDTLRRARRPGGVEEHRRIVAPDPRGLASVRLGGHGRLEARGAGRALAGPGHHDEVCAAGQRIRNVARMLPVRAQDPGAAMRHAVRDRVGAEAGEDRHVDRARLPHAEHDDEGLGHARQIARDAVSAVDSEGLQEICEPIAEPAELAKGVRAMGSVHAEPGKRRSVARRVAIDQGLAEAHVAARRPSEGAHAVRPAEVADRLVVGGLGGGRPGPEGHGLEGHGLIEEP